MSGDELHDRGLGALPIPGEPEFFSIRLRTALEAVPPIDWGAGPTRENVRQLISILRDTIAPELAHETEYADGTIVVAEHWAIELMDDLLGALDDLDDGITPPLLKKAELRAPDDVGEEGARPGAKKGNRNAKLSRSEQKKRDQIVEAAEIIHGFPKILNGKTVYKYLSQKLKFKNRKGSLTEAGVRDLVMNTRRKKITK